MRLVAVRLRKGAQRLDAFVRDESGKAHKIDLRWQTREPSDEAPANWIDTVRAEYHQRKIVDRDVLSALRKRT